MTIRVYFPGSMEEQGYISFKLWTALRKKQQFLSLWLVWWKLQKKAVDVGDIGLTSRRDEGSREAGWVVLRQRTDLDTGLAAQS